MKYVRSKFTPPPQGQFVHWDITSAKGKNVCEIGAAYRVDSKGTMLAF
jgi:hypothetical protein